MNVCVFHMCPTGMHKKKGQSEIRHSLIFKPSLHYTIFVVTLFRYLVFEQLWKINIDELFIGEHALKHFRNTLK